MPATNTKQEFIRIFNELSRHRNRYEVFRDFITCTAAALHNAVVKSETLEERYMDVVARYGEEFHTVAKLLPLLIDIMGERPRDTLGAFYMELEIGSEHMGQFFTPTDVSLMIAKLQNFTQLLKTQPYFTMHEPACGAGGMVLAVASEVIDAGYNPAACMWAQCIDIDRTAAMMCYTQLALWNIPAEVIVGNTLTMEFSEVYYTPAHHLYGWGSSLRRTQAMSELFALLGDSSPNSNEVPKHSTETSSAVEPILKPSAERQLRNADQLKLDF